MPLFTQTACTRSASFVPLMQSRSPQNGLRDSVIFRAWKLESNPPALASTLPRCKPFPQVVRIDSLPKHDGRLPRAGKMCLKTILAPPNLRKNCGERLADHPETLLYLGTVST